MTLNPPPGWDLLQEKANQAKTSDELAEIIAEMHALLNRQEKGQSEVVEVRSDCCTRPGSFKETK